MSTMEVGQKLVDLCRQGKNHEAIEGLYAKDVVSIEAAAMPGSPAETRGVEGVLGKSKWWRENHEVHSAEVEGPFPHGDRFIVVFKYDITNKPSGRRMKMHEAALFTVKDGKVAHEEFFYTTG